MGVDSDFIKEYLDRDAEARRIREEEAQIRYAGRKSEKMECRRRIEFAAMKICDMVDAASISTTEECKPEEIVALSAALNHVSAALNTAETYAESKPFFSTGFALGGGA